MGNGIAPDFPVLPTIAEIMGHHEENEVTLILDKSLDETDSEDASLLTMPTSGESLEEFDRRVLTELDLHEHGRTCRRYRSMNRSQETAFDTSMESEDDGTVIVEMKKRSNSVRFASDNQILGHAGYHDERSKNTLFYTEKEVKSFHSEFFEEIGRANNVGMTWKEWVDSRSDKDWEHEMKRFQLRNADKEFLRFPLSISRKSDSGSVSSLTTSDENSGEGSPNNRSGIS
jgi:hypothetical protein